MSFQRFILKNIISLLSLIWIIVFIAVWGLFSEIGFVIFLGVGFHNVLDLIYGIIKNKIHGRALSIFEWICSTKI